MWEKNEQCTSGLCIVSSSPCGCGSVCSRTVSVRKAAFFAFWKLMKRRHRAVSFIQFSVRGKCTEPRLGHCRRRRRCLRAFFNYLFASTSTSTRRNAQIMNGSRWSKTMKIENENEKRNKKKNARRNSIDFGWLTTTLMRCERLFNFINRRKLNERTTERQNERKPN